jgi:hypothetical protein
MIQYKVAQIAEEFGLQDIEDEMAEYWTTDEDSMSLRELATLFNRRVLAAATEQAGMDPLDGEIENIYRLLTDDDVSSGVRTETRKRLDRNGIDVDRLESSFVTYQAVRTYLKEGRDLEYEQDDDGDRIESIAASVNRLQNRTAAVTEEKISQLRRNADLSLGEYRVLLDLRVFCEDCGMQYEFGDLLEEGGCRCEKNAERA